MRLGFCLERGTTRFVPILTWYFIDMLKNKIGNAPRGKDQSLGVTWNELGCAWLQNENPNEAVPCFKNSINAPRALEGATKISISMPLINIAFAYLLAPG